MRKLISLALTALMILSMLTIGVFTTTVSAAPSASMGTVDSGYTPSGTPITTEAEFLAMEENGNYYLANDITLTKTYGAAYDKNGIMLGPDSDPLVELIFSGTFDGNGKTVTVSVPMFAEMEDATVKNLVIKGSINFRTDSGLGLPTHCGTVAMLGTDLTFENVSNSAPIKGFESGRSIRIQNPDGTEKILYEPVYTGGLIGACLGDLSMTNCENWADITALCASGMVGILEKATLLQDGSDNAMYTTAAFTNCHNYGTISDNDCYDLYAETESARELKVHGVSAGLLARATASKIDFTKCTNAGDILLTNSASKISFGGNCGGLGGDFERSDDLGNDMTVRYDACINDGTVIGARRTGGLGGYHKGNVIAINCINNGDVTSRTNYCAGIVGRGGVDSYPNFVCDLIFEHCVNNGTITSHRQYAGGITGFSQDRIKVNYCLNTGDILAEGISKTADNATHCHVVDCAGMIARSQQSIELYYCVNTGNIISNFAAAGIASRIGISSMNGVSFTGGYNTFFGCLSAGDITAYNEKHLYSVTQDENGDGYCDDSAYVYCSDDKLLADGTTGSDGICDKGYCGGQIGVDYHKTYYSSSIGAAGIINYSHGSENRQAPRVFGCGVTGNITATHGGTACAFIGYANTEFAMIQGNYFTGELNGPEECTVPHSVTLSDDYCLEYATAWINSCDSEKYIKNNYYLESIKDSGAMRIQNNGAEIGWSGYDCFITQQDIASGKLCYLANKAAYEFINVYPFLQRIGVDRFPTSPYYYLTYNATIDEVSIENLGTYIDIDYTYWVDQDANGNYVNVVHVPETTPKNPTTSDSNVTTEDPTIGGNTTTADPGSSNTTSSSGGNTPDPGTQPSGGDNAGGDKSEGGCGSVVGTSIALAAVALCAPAVIALKKREDEE